MIDSYNQLSWADPISFLPPLHVAVAMVAVIIKNIPQIVRISFYIFLYVETYEDDQKNKDVSITPVINTGQWCDHNYLIKPVVNFV